MYSIGNTCIKNKINIYEIGKGGTFDFSVLEESKKNLKMRPKSMQKLHNDDCKFLLYLGRNLNPGAFVGSGTKYIGNILQCTTVREKNTLTSALFI